MAAHRERLKKTNANVDTSSPATYDMLNNYNKKKLQIMEDRYTEIERENRILLEKITNIMQTSTTKSMSIYNKSKIIINYN
jgi:hypothetical protein